ncbi:MULTISPECIES: M48 family metalloprotease [Dyadobacter]|uniref:M48 family metalloprotease n=1 Tax=Dyadobacter chenhuakuii TaxID=2909339 RepID=A0A9X1TVG9_9BACT|nr:MULTISPECIES: M48 family metalloprotease [Dyadobacter]MCF2495470.1 M48 family metalloprotease [Dyadobacter chenhuakuii]MCF2500062.1 M48 family metalloprotease [Dyadobacter chenhuakuii]MCF2520301.1 M48 family metalloprotease [Dyadobacter sp. CY351]USJ29507.1 M48 family metalloprotease [Dyadobacter chenhuakuii]
MKMKFQFHILVCLIGAGFLSGCSKNPVTGKKEIIFMSKEKEIALGAESHPSIVATMGIYDDKNLQSFINEKGKAMANISHRPDLPYQFFIVDSPVVNAFAVPGGYVYFTRGIMAHFNNEAEFAGVLGHEIGHITARHSARQQTSQIFGQVGLMAGMVLSETVRGLADQTQQALGLLLLSYSREHESESDKIGVEYSSKIGYDAHQMADFFGTLKKISEKSGQTIPTFQSTHPDPGGRQSKVEKLATEYQKEHPAKYNVNRDAYLRKIEGIIYGTDPKQGFVENNMFYHPELKFQLPVPSGWQYENSPAQFQMAAKDGKSMMLFMLAPGKSLEEASAAVIKNYGLQVTENEKTTINGNPALVMIATQAAQTQSGQQAAPTANSIQVATWLIQYGGNIYAIHGVSQAANFAGSMGQFKSVAGGFKSVTDGSILNRQPDRIRIKTVQRDGSLKDALRDFNQQDKQMDDLAIINGMSLSDKVTKGTLIKTLSK